MESLNTLNSGIELYGIKSINIQCIVDLVKNCFQNNKAVSLILTSFLVLYRFFSKTLSER